MPGYFSQLPTVPVVVVQFYGQSSFKDFEATFYSINRVLRERDDPMIYLLVVMTHIEISYSNMIRAFETAQEMGFLSASASRVIPLVVGTHDLIQIFKDIARNRYPDFQIPYFHSLDEASSFLHHLLN